MSAFSLLISFAILAAIAAALLWPVFRRAEDPAGEAHEVERERLDAERAAVLAAIRELDLDHQTGKITEDDHTARRAQLVERGVEILKAIDQLPASHD
jgi:membrane protein implicated in regulation of membrane protease activity